MHDSNLLSRAQIFLERAKALDPDNIVASEFLHKVWTLIICFLQVENSLF
jgi:RNA polymerase I-specific transcription initiation factor RRN11